VTAIALLHGFSQAPESFDKLALPQQHVFAPLLLGHSGWQQTPEGKSLSTQTPERHYEVPEAAEAHWALQHGGFEAEVDRLARWLTERGFQRGVLCGYSLGARLALGLLCRHPALFTRALLLGVHPGLSSAEARRERLEQDIERCRLLTQDLDAFMDQWERQPLFASQSQLPSSQVNAQRQARRQHRESGLVQSLLQCGLAAMPDYLPALRDIQVPVLAVSGALDQKFTALAASVAGALNRGSAYVIPEAGHNVLIEKPDAVTDLLRQQLTP
jgi:2-succinyl-6-hydroxy-2,4-cyclohexadiene-1-carboxylate synthase